MSKIKFKIYIPYRLGLHHCEYEANIFQRKFEIGDVKLKLNLNISREEKDCYISAKTSVSEEAYLNDWVLMFDIAEIKVGKALQLFFNGLSRKYNWQVFYNVFDGHRIMLAYEVTGLNRTIKNPRKKIGESRFLSKEILNEAISYANDDNAHEKKASAFLLEGEHFVNVGRYESAIIQFSMMLEFLANSLLHSSGYINKNGSYINGHESKCNEAYKLKTGEDGSVPFSFEKFEYGFSLLNKKLEDKHIKLIDTIYKLRNRIAHGKTLLESFVDMGYDFSEEAIDDIEYNSYNFMINVSLEMKEIYRLMIS